jgi:hypothetical protein
MIYNADVKLKHLLSCVLLLACSACAGQPSLPLQPVPMDANTELSLGLFQCLAGTSYQFAPIESGLGRDYASGYERSTHNYLFMNTADLSFRKLFETNDFLITNTSQFPGQNLDGSVEGVIPATDCEAESNRVQWLFYSVVKADTNQDGTLSVADLTTFAVSDANGQNYTELLPNVQAVYGQTFQREPQRLIIVYQTDDGNRVSVIDLPTKTVVSTKQLPALNGNEP